MAEQSGKTRILVTGVADFSGAELVRELEEQDAVGFIAGLDFREPRRAFKRAEIVTADLRASALKHLLQTLSPEVVLHLQRVRSDQEGATNEELHEINVMGTLNLAATVRTIPSVRKFVLMSATHVYGADALDPAVFTEDIKPRTPPRSKYAGDLQEMESTVSQLARTMPRLVVTVLRFADIIGPRVNNAISRYLRLPVVPTVLGFDPRLQFCHEEDAVAALKRAALEEIAGVFNVAGDGAIYLSRALRLGGRIALPVVLPLAGPLLGMLRVAGFANIQPYHLQMLRYGRVVDTSRLRTRFGFVPRYSTVEAMLDLYNRSALTRARWEEQPETEQPGPAAA